MTKQRLMVTNVIWPHDNKLLEDLGLIEFSIYNENEAGRVRLDDNYQGWYLTFNCGSGQQVRNLAIQDGRYKARPEESHLIPKLLAEAANWMADICREDRAELLRAAEEAYRTDQNQS